MMNDKNSPNGKQYEHKDGLEYLPLYFHDFTPKLKQQAREELHEDENSRTALDKLLRMIKDKEGKDSPLSDEELIPFLRARKFDVVRAYNMYRKHCHTFCSEGSLFENFQFASNLRPIQSNFFCFVPKRNIDGCIVGCFFLKNWNLEEFDVTTILKIVTLGHIDIARCPITQITGVKYVADCSGLSLNHLLAFRPWHLKYFANILEKSMPLRVKGLHLVNNNHFVYLLWMILKTFLSRKFIERVHFHGTDLKAVHKFVCPSVLPEELGGSLGPQDNSEWLETFTQSDNYLTTYINKLREHSQK